MEAGHAGAAGGRTGWSAKELVDRLTAASTEAVLAVAGELDAAVDDNGVGKSSVRPMSMGRRDRAFLPMPYVRPRNIRHGGPSGSGAGRGARRERGKSTVEECWSPPKSSELSAGSAQITSGLTDEDTDSDSSDLDQRCPVSGDAAWARCWRLAPQMEDMAAGHETGPGESGSTQSCASMLDPRGSEGCAAADCVGGGEEVQAAAGSED